ncbi:MAG: glycosyltransferase family 2 protein [Chloroflexota bacterium]
MAVTEQRTGTTSLIMLTRDEIHGVRALFDHIPFHAVDECIAVDGGSTDGTVEFLEQRGLRVVRQSVPGRGLAFLIGAAETKGDYLVFFSPDGNEDPADIVRLIDLVKQGTDLAIASRFMKGARNEEDGKIIASRKWANLGFTLAFRLLWGGHITDTQNGFRGVRRARFEEMNLDAQQFEIESQMTIRALKLKCKVAEIPTREGDRIGGRSKLPPIPTGLRILRVMARELLLKTRFRRQPLSEKPQS